MTADPFEPDLNPGDSGDAVLRLQTRLQALGLFAGSLDGHFGDDTGLAVQELHERAGLAAPGVVDADCWAALAAAEQASGAAAYPAAPDEQWQWDGESWQATAGADVACSPAPVGDAPVDATGQWLWDGTQWQPVVDDGRR